VIAVSRLSVSPVKGFQLVHPDEVTLGANGVAENRRFYLVDERGLRFGQLRHGPLVRISAWYEPEREHLVFRFHDGRETAGTVELGGPVTTDFYGRPVAGHLVEGPWSAAVSDYIGRELRLVRADAPGGGIDRARGGVSILSEASVAELARRAGRDTVDDRRFRMLIHVAGAEAHEEDTWIGRELEIGEAIVRIRGDVGRCAITTQDPETGVGDFDTLREIKRYRGVTTEKKHIPFGVFGEVVAPGRVRIGDPVRPLERSRLDRPA
jgi:uncharacterized protein YcbX